MTYQKYISINPKIRFGKPCISGTRITVYDVLAWLSLDMSFEEILEEHPQLNKPQLLACLEYASDKEKQITYA